MVRVPPLTGPAAVAVGAVVGASVAAATVGASVAGAVVGAVVGATVGAVVGKTTAVGAGATVLVGTTAGAADAPNSTLPIMRCDRAINKLLCFIVLSPVSGQGVQAGGMGGVPRQ